MSEESRDTILRAARAVFVERGFAGASMSRIAQEAGITQSLIHYHFKSKEELWEAAKTEIFRRYADAQREAFANRSGDISLLEEAMRNYFAFLRDNPEFVRMIDWHNLETALDAQPDELMELGYTVMAEGTEKIREAQRQGLFREDIEPVHVILLFTSVFENWFSSAYCREIAGMLAKGTGSSDATALATVPATVPATPGTTAPADDGGACDARFMEDVIRIVLRGLEPRS